MEIKEQFMLDFEREFAAAGLTENTNLHNTGVLLIKEGIVEGVNQKDLRKPNPILYRYNDDLGLVF